MTSFSEELLSAQPSEAPKSFAAELLSPQQQRQSAPQRTTALATESPEVTTSPEMNQFTREAAFATAGFLSALDQDERANILQSQFGDVFSIAEDAEGNLVATNPDGEAFAINRPGVSPSDLTNFIARTLINLPAGRARSGLTRMAPNIASRAAQIAGKTAATEAGLQAVESALGGDFDAGEVGLAAATGGVVEGVTAIPGARSVARQADELFDASQQQVRQTREAAGDVGLFRAQQVGDPFLLQEQAFIGELPPGARTAVNALRNQNEEVARRVRGFLDDFGTPESVVVGPRAIRDKAQKAIELRKLAREAKASPLYQRAFAEFEGPLDVGPVVQHIDRQLAAYPVRHPAHKALRQFKDEIIENADSLQRLQGVKEGVDVKIANLSQGRSSSATNKANRELNDAQNLLLQRMDEASPTFAEARATFARESGPVDSLRNSLVGTIADIPDQRLRTVARTIFDPSETNPEVVKEARRAILAIEGGDDAWDKIVRVELERRLGSVRAAVDDSLIGGETIENLPSQLRRALFRNKKDRDVLFAGLTDKQIEAAQFLEDTLRRAASGRPGGSQTAIREEIKRRFDRGFWSGMRRFLSEPITTVAQIGEEGIRDKRIQSVVEVVFDPNWSGEVLRLKRLQGDQSTAFEALFEKAFNGLLTPPRVIQATAQAARSQAGNADRQEPGNPGQ